MASTEVASLHATLKADASQLKRELDQSKGRLDKFKDSVDQSTRPIRSLDSSLRTLGVAFGVATAAVYTLKKAFDFAKEGAEMDFIVGKFDRLAESIGTTSTALQRDLKIATRGTMSDMELMAGASDLMALGLAKTHDEAVRLTRVSAALGMNMNQLVLTLTNQTTMRFDALGVAVDGFDAKVKKLEASGKNANEAFKLAFLEQAEEQLARVGERADSTAGSFDRLAASWANLQDQFKRDIAPPLARVLDYISASNALQTALELGILTGDEYNQKWVEINSTFGGLKNTGQSLVPVIDDLNRRIAEFQGKPILLDISTDFGKGEFVDRIRNQFVGLGTEVATMFGDEYKAQMSALDLSISGQLGEEQRSFMDTQQELIDKAAELKARIAEASTYPSTLEQQQELFNLRNALSETNEAIRLNASEHEMATKRILFSLLTQRIAQMELSETTKGVAYQMAYDMALAWGLIDEQTYKAINSIDKGLGLLAQGNIKGAQAEIVRLGQLAASVAGDYYINYIVTTTYVESVTGGSIKKGDQSKNAQAQMGGFKPQVFTPPGGYYPGGFGGGSGGGGLGSSSVMGETKSLLQKLLETASALEQVGQSAVSMWEAQLGPMRDQLKAIDDLMRPGHIDIYVLDRMEEMTERRAALAHEIADAEEKILRLQEQQQKLRYLESQVRLLELIKENKLNAKDILGGMKLGINAEMGDIIDATTKALAALIEKIQKQLKIGSPSKVMYDIGKYMMQGWSQGITFNAGEIKNAMDTALQLSVPSGAPGYGYSDGGATEITVNMPIENINSLLDMEQIAYRVAEVMNYRNR